MSEGIKDKEERWRRKVICKRSRASFRREETRYTGSGAAVKPQDILLDSVDGPYLQGGPYGVVQSGESEEEEAPRYPELESVLKGGFVKIYFSPSGTVVLWIKKPISYHYCGRRGLFSLSFCGDMWPHVIKT